MMDVVLYFPTIQCGIQARNAYMVKFLMIIINLQKIKILINIYNIYIIFLVIVDVQSSL